jgi:hypothetical protein
MIVWVGVIGVIIVISKVIGQGGGSLEEGSAEDWPMADDQVNDVGGCSNYKFPVAVPMLDLDHLFPPKGLGIEH